MGLDDEQYAEVEVDIVTDLASLRPRRVNAADLIRNANISPSGKRAVIQARGELFTVPAKHGVIQNLSRTSGAARKRHANSPSEARRQYTQPSAHPNSTRPLWIVGGVSSRPPVV